MAKEIKVRERHIGEYKPDPNNVREHNARGQAALVDSLHEVGAARSLVADADDTIQAGNGVWEAAAEAGIENVIEIETDGDAIIVHKRRDLTDEKADMKQKLAIYDNRASELSNWNFPGLASAIKDLEARGALSHQLFADYEIKPLVETDWTLENTIDQDRIEVEIEREKIKDIKPNPRNLPLDVIFTFDNQGDPSCTIAYKAGFGIGTRSNPQALRSVERWNWRFGLVFIDNEYKNYDHEFHMKVLEFHRPKYATVRDIMTEAQCEAAGIAYYPFEQVMEFAAEAAQYAENVIVIPKYDCFDRIPDEYVLGYSVPSSYGGTPVPAEKFRGRRVHLLGGSWKRQLEYLHFLGDDVVSLDTNWIHKVAQYGHFVWPDGRCGNIYEDLHLNVNNGLYTAFAISAGHIGRAVFELTHQKELEPTATGEGTELNELDLEILPDDREEPVKDLGDGA